jgi:hypothetical protein
VAGDLRRRWFLPVDASRGWQGGKKTSECIEDMLRVVLRVPMRHGAGEFECAFPSSACNCGPKLNNYDMAQLPLQPA